MDWIINNWDTTAPLLQLLVPELVTLLPMRFLLLLISYKVPNRRHYEIP